MKFKARWMIHEYKQENKLNYLNTSVTMIKSMSYKFFMTISIKRNFKIRHMNMMIVFFYEFLDEVIYVTQFILFEIKNKKQIVCILKKAFYDLKQTSRVWYQTIQNFLQKLEFKRCDSNHDVFTNETIFIAIYVNDLLLFEKDIFDLQRIQNELMFRFRMTDLEEISHYLEMQVNVENDFLTLRQITYLIKLLNRFNMIDCKSISTLMKSEISNNLTKYEQQANQTTIQWYQQLIDSLIWSFMHTRLDIAYSVRVLSKYCFNSFFEHCLLLKRILRYLSKTLKLEIIFKKNSHDDLIEYTDSNWAELADERKSTAAYVFYLVDDSISHCTKQQSIVALSTIEAEYMTLSKTEKKAIWCAKFLKELNYKKNIKSILLWIDNKKSIFFIENSEFHKRIKHINIRWHWIRDAVERNQINLKYFSTKAMTADELIKSLSTFAFKNFIERIKMNINDRVDESMI